MFIAPCLVEVRACAIQNCSEEMSLLFFSICCHKVFCYLRQKRQGGEEGQRLKNSCLQMNTFDNC